MPLDASVLRRALRTLSSKVVSQEEAVSLASILDSREEMLAYLVFKTDFLKLHPDAREVLLRAAKEGGYEAATVRKSDRSVAVTRRAAAEMQDCISALISSEKQLAQTLSQISSVDEAVVKYASNDWQSISPERWIKP